MRVGLARAMMAAAVALALAAPATFAQDAVRIASKIDTEGALLGNMMLEMLEAAGIKTINKLQLGPTNILRSAIIAGEIDAYPEYTGNGAIFYSLQSDPSGSPPRRSSSKARRRCRPSSAPTASSCASRRSSRSRAATPPSPSAPRPRASPASMPPWPMARTARSRCSSSSS